MLPQPLRTLLVAALTCQSVLPSAYDLAERLMRGSQLELGHALPVAFVVLQALVWPLLAGMRWAVRRTDTFPRSPALLSVAARAVWAVCLVSLIGCLWWMDLRHARFGLVLGLIPVGAAGLAVVMYALGAAGRGTRWVSGTGWHGAAWGTAAGASGAVSLIWGLMFVRAVGMGCGTPSAVYEQFLFFGGVLMLAAPWAIGMMPSPTDSTSASAARRAEPSPQCEC